MSVRVLVLLVIAGSHLAGFATAVAPSVLVRPECLVDASTFDSRTIPEVVAGNFVVRWHGVRSAAMADDGRTDVVGAVAAEQARIDSLPPGLPGLERGAEWYRDFVRRYPPAQRPPEMMELEKAFIARRERAIEKARPELVALLKSATSNHELNMVFRTYLPLKSDEKSPLVQNLVEIGRVRSQELGRATNEPNDVQMEAAVKALVGDYVRELNDTLAECHRGGYRDNPVLAARCLYLLGANNGRPFSVEISNVRGHGCSRQENERGVLCRYTASVHMPSDNAPPGLDWVLSGNEKILRFVWNGGRWVAVVPN